MTTIQTSAPAATIQALLKELDQEAQTTRSLLSRIPNDQFDWQPHAKSMTVRQLANHIGELPTWLTMALTTDELDFEKNPYEAETNSNTADVLSYFERSLEQGRNTLASASEDDLLPGWVLRSGEQILLSMTKGEVIRMTYCQTVHHRAQLGVYLRLLNVPIPGSYGPSYDELNGLL